MKTKILALLKGMCSDSKTETYKCETELCEILTDFCNKLKSIEKSVNAYIIDYPDSIIEIDEDNAYTGMKKLPEIIYCNYGSFEFETSWLDMDLKAYFEKLKKSSIQSKETTIANLNSELYRHKEELGNLRKLTYENLK